MRVEVVDIRSCPYLLLIPQTAFERCLLDTIKKRAESIIQDVFVEDYLSINQNGAMEINLKPLQLEPPEEEYQDQKGDAG